MQKKLIAAAVAGLLAVPALAQTNVTISGRAAAGWESYKLQDCTTGFSCRNESRVSDQSSRIIFNVNEDLGGGLKAWAQMDMRYGNDMGGIGMTGNTGMGLMSNSWGKFTIGRWDVHYGEFAAIEGNRAGSLQTLLGTGIMSQVSAATGGGLVTLGNGTRTPNLLMWDSPNWNGFTARLAYSTAGVAIPVTGEGSGRSVTGTANPGGGSAWTGTVRYNNGPWTGGVSYWNGDTEARPAAGASSFDQDGWKAWAGYTFAMGLKIGLGYDRSNIDRSAVLGDARRSAWMLPVSYTFGPHAVYAKYAHAGKVSNIANSGAHAWGLGYDYAFSKRTSAGVYYTKLNNKGGAFYDLFAVPGANGATVTAVGEDVRQIYIGMAHNF
jgi:predicted porin